MQSEDKISRDELREMFGEAIPIEAVNIFWGGPDDMTVGQCRAKLRELAARQVIVHGTLRAANEARQVEWDAGNQLSAAYRGNELAGEVGEACNVIKKLERERLGIRGSRDTVDHLAEELADVIICVDLLAMHYGINLDAAVARKFNATSEKVGLKTRLVGA